MEQSSDRPRRSRTISILAVFVTIAIAMSATIAQGRVAPSDGGAAMPQDPGTVAKTTGGGTVLAQPTYNTTIASFGLNARRPVNFLGDGLAEGRIIYNRHRNSTGRLFNVKVVLMQATATNTPPNGTGGTATIIGDCNIPGSTCPSTGSALVQVEDNSDDGSVADRFTITFCSGAPALPTPAGCGAAEGGALRTGNIQIHPDPGVAGEAISTAGAAGVFATTQNFNGVELAGGIFSLGVRSDSGTAYGDLHVEYTGISLIGLYQIISVDAWITGATTIGGTTTLTGTCSLDMGDGPPPVGGLSFTGTLTATGIAITVGGSSIPALPKTDGFIESE